MPDSTPPTIPAATPETTAAPAGPSNLRLRVIWGVIGAVLLLGSVWFSPFTFGLFFAAVQAIMLWEFYRMMRAGGYAPATWIGVGVSLVLFTGFAYTTFITDYLAATGDVPHVIGNAVIYQNRMNAEYYGLFFRKMLPAVILLTPVSLILVEMRNWPRVKAPFTNIGITLTGLLYVSLPMTLLNIIAVDSKSGYDYRRVFALLFLIWASDIGAYAVGRAIGKHKLAPQISPGKTWEGWAGGFAMTLLVGWAIGYMLPDMPLTHRLVAAGVVAVFAPLGDLAESMLKRSVGVKDSGSIMPGHGGLLDRFDAFLLVLPVLALLQLLAG
ncbi:phosphatidate cytidylyltransferase [Microvirga sp. STS02]|uniref:phosphatidate cytidylyltransferase n=1 Tax=Hymenobacter negativus TaxID=2795026 RepID=UPI0018DD4376|nr:MULTISPECIES: phosphatidate cytidylyltransferase [Bacteria]MBH8570837.1 phosphatidate cytidylyltransferase [Hymenobacter negativus]MBR7210574.1 phosphatidate cytidylyltransferase [Microvirga sp. STS02]